MNPQRKENILQPSCSVDVFGNACWLFIADAFGYACVCIAHLLYFEWLPFFPLCFLFFLLMSIATLLALLTVFQEGKLQEYNQFLNQFGGTAILAKYGLDPETCIRHLRILSLCSLAAEHEEIPYADVATTLALDTNKSEIVEQWVIAAVSSGLLHAKMDQLQQKVMVERSVVRKFDLQQWQVLQTRLRMWKTHVGNILQAYQQQQQQQSAQHPQGNNANFAMTAL